MNKLNTTEASRLMACEKVITDGRQGFIKVGMALEEIRDKKLYRARFGSFQEYCVRKWGFNRSYGYQLIESASTARRLSASADSPGIPNEATARALAGIPEPQRADVLKRAHASGTVTAPAIRKAASEADKPVIQLDKTGFPIPPRIMPIWDRRDEVQEILLQVSRVKSSIKKAQDSKDPLFSEVNFSSVLAYLDNIYGGIKRALPFTVCPQCQGKLPDKCQLCSGRGIISECLYQRVDMKLRQMREKMVGR